MTSKNSVIYSQQSSIPYELSQADEVFLNKLAQVDLLYNISDESFAKSKDTLPVFHYNAVQVSSSYVELENITSIIFFY